MKNDFKKLYVQKNMWKNHNINAIYWAFYCINDNQKVNVKVSQTMRCILCYNNLVLESSLKLKPKKVYLYNKANGIIFLKKHVFSNHLKIAKKNWNRGEQSIKIKKIGKKTC